MYINHVVVVIFVQGVNRTMVHLNDHSRAQERFSGIGSFIVDETQLVVGKLDQFFCSAQAVELLLHRDSKIDVCRHIEIC